MRSRRLRHLHAIVLASACLLVCGPQWIVVVRASAEEPRAFGAVRLLMTEEEVQKIHPEMKPLAQPGAQAEINLSAYAIGNQKFDGLGPCQVQFRFAAGLLYTIAFDCGRDEKVIDTLKKKFGPPTMEKDYGTYWYWDKTAVSLNPKAKTFGFVDLDVERRVQAALLKVVLTKQREGTGAAAQATPSPPSASQGK